MSRTNMQSDHHYKSIYKLEGSNTNYPLWRSNFLKELKAKNCSLVLNMPIPHVALAAYSTINPAVHLQLQALSAKTGTAPYDPVPPPPVKDENSAQIQFERSSLEIALRTFDETKELLATKMSLARTVKPDAVAKNALHSSIVSLTLQLEDVQNQIDSYNSSIAALSSPKALNTTLTPHSLHSVFRMCYLGI